MQGAQRVFEIGDEVRRRGTDVVGVVVGTSNGLVEVRFIDGRATLHPDELSPVEAEPGDRLVRRDLGHVDAYGLRLHALFLEHAYRYDPIAALSNARIEPELHQVFVAHRVANKLAPRMILSDEVGLGKTIEAALIIKELRARGMIDRVLIVVPASLQLQWQRELSSKFNERFTIVDGAAAKHFGRGGKNPFDAHQNVICSHAFATRDPRPEQITESPWDLVVFDEAHRVRRSLQGGSPKPTRLYQLAEELKDRANGMILLTATPMQLSNYELWSAIELVEPGLFPAYRDYARSADLLPRLNEAMRCLQSWGALSGHDRARFLKSSASETLRDVTGLTPPFHELELPEERAAAQEALVESHPLAQVLVRNRKHNVGGFTRRQAHRVLVPLSSDEQHAYDRVTEYLRHGYAQALAKKQTAIGFLMVTYHKLLASSSYAIRESLKRRITKLETLRDEVLGDASEDQETQGHGLAPTRADEFREADTLSDVFDQYETAVDLDALDWEIEEIQVLVDLLGKLRDSKVRELLRLVTGRVEHAEDKVLIFTQFVETQLFLQQVLEGNGFEVATFNGRMTLEEKEAEVERFRDQAQVLISTESGGEGRNFQFAHILVNYDLPWNPMKVEQRIGRLDRIGQQHDVEIYNLVAEGTVEERVLELLEERIQLFEASVGSLDPILGTVERDIEQIVMTASDVTHRLADYGEKSLEQKLAEAREKEHALADFVLDQSSLRRDQARQLVEGANPMARASDLERYVGNVLAEYGGKLTRTEDDDAAITLSPGLAAKLKAPTLTVGVFDPRAALRREHRPFLAFGHSLVDALVSLPLHDDPQSACVQKRDDVTDPVVEVIYEVITEGLATRGEVIRHQVTENGVVTAEALRRMPQVGDEMADDKPPEWAPGALQASKAAISKHLTSRREEILASDEEVRAAKLERVERVAAEARRRHRRHIAELEERIKDIQMRGTEKQQRIIAAWQGQVAKTEERLRDLEAKYQEQSAQILRSQSSTRFQVLAASYVVPS